MTIQLEATTSAAEFIFDPSRFTTEWAIRVIDDFLQSHTSQRDQMAMLCGGVFDGTTLSGRWFRDNGVDVHALAQRIEDIAEDECLDLGDLESLVLEGMDCRRLNLALRSTLPTADLDTALRHVEPLRWVVERNHRHAA